MVVLDGLEDGLVFVDVDADGVLNCSLLPMTVMV